MDFALHFFSLDNRSALMVVYAVTKVVFYVFTNAFLSNVMVPSGRKLAIRLGMKKLAGAEGKDTVLVGGGWAVSGVVFGTWKVIGDTG